MKRLFKNQQGFSHHLLLPIAVIAAVTVIGGYVLVKSHAASFANPPKKYYAPIGWVGIPIAVDNTQGYVGCPGYRFNAYGVSSYCYENTFKRFRTGYYNFSTNKFVPDSGWYTDTQYQKYGIPDGDLLVCPDGLRFIPDVQNVQTPYGQADLGVVIIQDKVGNWFAEPSIYNLSIKKCVPVNGSPQYEVTN